jgi:hypothetical protein
MNLLPDIILTKIKRSHQGKENAIKRKDLLWFCQGAYQDLTDRELRNIYCQLPVISSNAGIFWPVRQSELYEFQSYLKKKAIPLFNRYKMVAKEHRHLMDYGDVIQWNLF